MTIRILFCFSLLALSFSAYADKVSCTGKPQDIVIWGNGNDWFAVKLEEYSAYWVLCDLNNDFGGISAKNCNAMYSAALSAWSTHKYLMIQFSNDSYTTCTDVPSWNTGLPNDLKLVYLRQ